ncbi:hypothetical protein QM480_18455 [Flectobacillus sp. DC10W]|uniref:DnaA N-terminal domain-containing protein n=1 Tax=Flectobacillus longus TaxID=2984207 RepID=A0ABT6YRV9_9BACT|nr:hypothetical protein [Flectobacillus longus]MDI9866328.1 hypothetical protein [Flectobacillus longus]
MRTIRFSVPKQEENPEIISEKVFSFLHGLRNINESIFSDWFQQGWSKKEALSKKVDIEKNYLLSVVNKNWDKKFPELGTKFSLWTGKDNDLFNCISTFSLGKTTKNSNIRNIVTLVVPKQENVPDIGENEIQSIISLMKEIWGEQDFEISL